MSNKYFVNPYNFVRTKECDPKTMCRPVTHEKFSGYSGTILCNLKTLTRTFIPYNQDYVQKTLQLPTVVNYTNRRNEQKEHTIKYQICDSNENPLIPGSSLKGVIRSVAEAISNGCGFPHGKNCSDSQLLCICCILFGMTAGVENKFLGKVSIQDATTEKPDALIKDERGVILESVGSPKPEHTPFYEIKGKKRGRKFYYHQNEGQAEENVRQIRSNNLLEALDRQYPKTVLRSWIKANVIFSFKVEFTNLTEEELGFFLYSLELEDILQDGKKVGMYHKIGMAKPQGFGSCEIKITDLKLIDNSLLRYKNLGDGINNRIDKVQLFKEKFFQGYFNVNWTDKNKLQNISDLQKIMSLNGYQIQNIHYPSKDNDPNKSWFAQNPTTPLPTIEDVFNNKNMLIEL